MATSRKELDELAATIRQSGASWQSGETSMTALNADDRKKRLGVTLHPTHPRSKKS